MRRLGNCNNMNDSHCTTAIDFGCKLFQKSVLICEQANTGVKYMIKCVFVKIYDTYLSLLP